MLILLAGAGATPALAGEYPVYACEPAHGDVNRSWTASSSHAAVTAYANCPVAPSEIRAWNQGLVTRSAILGSTPGATVPYGAYGALTFRAPAGATLARMSYSHTFCGGASFKAGLVNGSLAWLHASGPSACGTLIASPYTLSLGGTNAVLLITSCQRTTCRVDSASSPYGYATMRSATVWVRDWTTPSITVTGGSAVTQGWKSGVVTVGAQFTDNVGIQSVELRHGTRVVDDGRTVCDFTRPVPCPNHAGTLTIDTRSTADGIQPFALKARDAAGNESGRTFTVSIDNTPPGPPLEPNVREGSGWQRRNAFSVSWRNPPQTGTAPIAEAHVAVCPAANRADQWAGCVYTHSAQPEITGMSGLRVPGPGEWVGRIWLEDAAGNTSAATAQTVDLRLDDSPPQVAFKPIDLSDPTRIDLRVVEHVSGLARTDVEVRRRGDAGWIPLATASTPDGVTARLDDEHLADGVYDLRARAADNAGNEQSTHRELSGAHASRSVPTRIQTRLVAGHVKRLKARRSPGGRRRSRWVIVVRPTIRYGRTIPIRGRLTMPGGNPVTDANVEVSERIALPGAQWEPVSVVATDRAGRFVFKALRGPSRTLRFRYPGTALVRARTTEVDLEVKAASALRSNRRRVVNGEEIVLRGRVMGGPLPGVGKLVQLQAFSRGRWLTFATPRANAVTGRWSYRYRFTATRGTVRYRFRARVPAESGFPFATGASRSVYVVVRGL